MPDYALEALEKLRSAARALMVQRGIPGPIRAGCGIIDDAPDLDNAARVTVALILDIDDIADRLAAAGKAMRDTLAAVIDETGMPPIYTAHHVASGTSGRASVAIIDEAKIPLEYFSTPAPQPEKARIASALKAGAPVPGAALRNGAPGLSIRSREKTR